MQKSASVAFVLWAFLGSFGAHRFYVGRTSTGLAMLSLAAAGTVLASAAQGWMELAGAVALLAGAVWSFTDLRNLRTWVDGGNPV